MTFTIDLSKVKTREELHDLLQEELPLPEYYGRNLDALYDLLTEPTEPATLTIYAWDKLAETLGEKAAPLRRVLEDAGQENPALTVLLLSEDDDI